MLPRIALLACLAWAGPVVAADVEDVAVGEGELSQWLLMQAPRYGMSPDQFAQALVEAGQVPMAVSEGRQGLAAAHLRNSREDHTGLGQSSGVLGR